MEQNTLKIRLKKFLKSERISNTEFATICDVSAAYVTSVKQNISFEILQKIVNINKNLNLNWLLFGTGMMYSNSTEEIERMKKTISEQNEKIAMLQKIVELYEVAKTAQKND